VFIFKGFHEKDKYRRDRTKRSFSEKPEFFIRTKKMNYKETTTGVVIGKTVPMAGIEPERR
jgi:hypothetical protein